MRTSNSTHKNWWSLSKIRDSNGRFRFHQFGSFFTYFPFPLKLMAIRCMWLLSMGNLNFSNKLRSLKFVQCFFCDKDEKNIFFSGMEVIIEFTIWSSRMNESFALSEISDWWKKFEFVTYVNIFRNWIRSNFIFSFFFSFIWRKKKRKVSINHFVISVELIVTSEMPCIKIWTTEK